MRRRNILILLSLFTAVLFFFIYKLIIVEKVSRNYYNISSNVYMNLFNPENLKYTFLNYNPTMKNNKILLEKDIKGYTSFAYSESSNKLYFVDVASNNTNQLFVRDLQNNKQKQLTKGIASVDIIQIDKKQKMIFMRVLLHGEEKRNFHMATYNIENDKLEVWDESNTDNSILDFSYDPNSDKLLLISFSENDAKSKLEESNNQQISMVSPRYSLDIHNPNGNKEENILTTERFINGISFDYNTKSVFLSYDNDLSASVSKVVKIDILTKKEQILLTSSDKHSKIRGIQLDKERKGLFFLSSQNAKNTSSLDNFKQNVISYYDIDDDKIEDIWKTDKDIIVNYSINMN
ncbi:hypothetical protein [Bacillus thuringiensis]|uniref:hypothetical protein n=1 Tax=Bacillus thuringiensis TaxID=1428 RepID=UPI0005CEB01B|nr:hypothetical protein [Bacillus thuringiensis]